MIPIRAVITAIRYDLAPTLPPRLPATKAGSPVGCLTALICMGWTLLLLLLVSCSSQTHDERRILEWGWDTPDLQYIAEYLPLAQDLPFDGVVVDIATPLDDRGLSWTLFGHQAVDERVLDQLASEYADLAWERLTDNFLRLTVYPANVGWFEDWATIYINTAAWARLARDLGFTGLMLDVEQYSEANLFHYPSQAQASELSFEAFAEQAVEQGQAFMEALQQGFPGLTLIYTYALTIEPNGVSVDWSSHRYGLLIPFVEGMVSSADPTTTLVDGFEHSYIYQTEHQFVEARDLMKGIEPRYVENRAFRSPEVGFGLWIDPVCGDGGLLEEGCGFSADGFSQALEFALHYSDRYVWVYSQHINWYTGDRIPGVWMDMMRQFNDELQVYRDRLCQALITVKYRRYSRSLAT